MYSLLNAIGRLSRTISAAAPAETRQLVARHESLNDPLFVPFVPGLVELESAEVSHFQIFELAWLAVAAELGLLDDLHFPLLPTPRPQHKQAFLDVDPRDRLRAPYGNCSGARPARGR